jgi:hypothetical protein
MTDFEFLGGFGLRDIVLVVAALIGVYLALSLMRLFQIGGKARDKAPQSGRRVWFKRTGAASPEAAQAPPEAAQAPPEAAAAPTEFAEKLAQSSVGIELQSLRRETALLREEVARLADEVARLKATQNVSPLYNEAMSLAQQGMPVAGIAGRCGISIGEAELVAALARSGSEIEQPHHDEDRNGRNADSGSRSRI